MARETYVLRNGELIEKRLAEPLHVAHGSGPNIRPDGMDPIQSQADGRMYDSKSGYYRSVRQAGCEIVGNDRSGYGPRPEYRPTGIGQDIKRSIEQLRSRG